MSWAVSHWGAIEGRALLRGLDLPSLNSRRLMNVVHALAAENLDPNGIQQFEDWLNPPPPPKPQSFEERLEDWGESPEAQAGQEALIAMLGGMG